jgi:hypothetical protein
LSAPKTGEIESLFHSRLAANSTGTRILSAGWFWHPFDCISVFDLKTSSDGLLHFERSDGCCNVGVEISNATFRRDGYLLIASNKTAEDFNEDEPGDRFRPGSIAVIDLDAQRTVSIARVDEDVGTMFPVGSKYILSCYDHPKLIELATGQVLQTWPDVKSGKQSSSIIWHIELPPSIAFDETNGRLAVAAEDHISVISLNPGLLN